MERPVVTRRNVDLDAILSVCAVVYYVLSGCIRDCVIRFVNANDDGSSMGPLDIIVDVEAGGRGIKGEKKDGKVHSCFALLIERFAPPEDRQILRYLVDFVDIHDSQGSVIDRVIPGAPERARAMLSAVTIGNIVNALKEELHDDRTIIDAIYPIFVGMIKLGRKRMAAIRDMSGLEFFADRQVVLMTNRDSALLAPMFHRGVQVIIYDNNVGLGVVRNSRSNIAAEFRTDNDIVRAMVVEAGEEFGNEDGKWFAHESGFLFCRGSKTSPLQGAKSKVDPHNLAMAVAQAWKEYVTKKKG